MKSGPQRVVGRCVFTLHSHEKPCRNEDFEEPITVLFGLKSDYDKLHPFGCLAFIHITKKDRHGAMNKATHYGALLGYSVGSDDRIINYRVFDYATHRFVFPSNVTFNDDISAVSYIDSLCIYYIYI